LKSKAVTKKTSKPNNPTTASASTTIQHIQEQQYKIFSEDLTSRSHLDLDISAATSTYYKSAITIDNSSLDVSTSKIAVR